MSSQTETPKVLAALAQLDPANDAHWTTDGLPNTGVVQRLANDQTIKRSDIQNSRPGFDRASATLAAAGQQEQRPVDFEEAPPAVVTTSIEPIAPVAQAAPAPESETVEVSEAQLHGALNKQVQDAEEKIRAGRAMVSQGTQMTDEAMLELRKAQANFHKYFPPTTQAQNVREFLDASNAERAARVAARGSASQLDAARHGGNSRGWNGQTQSRGPGGVRAYSRKEAMSLGLVVPGSAAAAGRAPPVAFRGGSVKA
jgi:hypothetical protein